MYYVRRPSRLQRKGDSFKRFQVVDVGMGEVDTRNIYPDRCEEGDRVEAEGTVEGSAKGICALAGTCGVTVDVAFWLAAGRSPGIAIKSEGAGPVKGQGKVEGAEQDGLELEDFVASDEELVSEAATESDSGIELGGEVTGEVKGEVKGEGAVTVEGAVVGDGAVEAGAAVAVKDMKGVSVGVGGAV